MSDTSGRLVGKTCVITGATSGIGRATARALAFTGLDLILIGRQVRAGNRLAAELRKCPGAGRVEFLTADLSAQQEVRGLASSITSKHERIDILINNAGARFNHFRQSRDGIELTFATNHLSHFLLTCLLRESLQRDGGSRVVTVGSGAHTGTDARGPWVLGEPNYDRKLAYSKSKLANIMFAFELARRWRGTGVVSNAVDPGGVATNLGRNNGLLSWCRHLAYYALKRELLSPRKGAETLVMLAISAELNGVSGKYFCRKAEVEASLAARDLEAAAGLWRLSAEMTQLSRKTEPVSMKGDAP